MAFAGLKEQGGGGSGEVTSVETIGPNFFVEQFTLTQSQAQNKEIFLSDQPSGPNKILLNLIGGIQQLRGQDFEVDGNRIYWVGFALETVLSEGDKLNVTYVK